MSISRTSVATAYAATRLAQFALRTRRDIEARQARLWQRLKPAIARTPAIAHLADAPLDAFAVVDARDMRTDLNAWNSLGLAADSIRAAAEAAETGEAGEVRPGVFAGFSTGSEGGRGVFLSSEAERARYIGQSLAKLIPDNILKPRRIGLCLRANNALYRDVESAGPFTFRFFELSMPTRAIAQGVEEFSPDIFIAPSHVLAALARLATEKRFVPPAFGRLFFGAEPMGRGERVWIGDVLGVRPDPIYQATEGFLAASCKHGGLHLNEDSLVVELERIGGSNRFRPIITDLYRTSQPMVRVRLDDLIELQDAPCPCRSPLRAILPIEGRLADIWRWGDVVLFPREVEDTVSSAIGAALEWSAVASPAGVHLSLDDQFAPTAREALLALLTRHGLSQAITVSSSEPQTGSKRRRVRWADG